MDDKEIVSAIHAALADKVGQERFDLWLGAAARLSVRGETLLVELASRFAQDWVRSHFRREIEAACAQTLGKPLAVEFAVDPTLAPSPGASKRTARHAAANGTKNAGAGPADSSVPAAQRGQCNGSHASGSHVSQPPADAPAQSELSPGDISNGCGKPGFVRRRFAALEQYVVGPSNRLAHASAQMAAEQPGRVSPLLVYGATGVGKTHLLEGIWTAARRSRAGIHAVYLSAEQFTTYFLEALHGSGLPSFRRKYRGVELLIIDGLQFFAGKRATLIELLHTVDTLLREGRQLVFAADRSPATLRELGEEFLTRLSSGMVCGIDPPDYPTRLGILRQMAQARGFALTDDVAEFVATHLTANARELSGALNRLEAAARISRQALTRSMAEEALSEIIRHNARPVRLEDIERAVCDVFGLAPESLQSARRDKDVCQPRMLAMYLARKLTRAALSEIGRHFGRRSHSTVVSAQKNMSGLVASQATIELHGKRWTVEEAIRRVEEQLRTA